MQIHFCLIETSHCCFIQNSELETIFISTLRVNRLWILFVKFVLLASKILETHNIYWVHFNHEICCRGLGVIRDFGLIYILVVDMVLIEKNLVFCPLIKTGNFLMSYTLILIFILILKNQVLLELKQDP